MEARSVEDLLRLLLGRGKAPVLILLHPCLGPDGPGSNLPDRIGDVRQAIRALEVAERVAGELACGLVTVRVDLGNVPQAADVLGLVAGGRVAAVVLNGKLPHLLELTHEVTESDFRTWLWPCLHLRPKTDRQLLLAAAYRIAQQPDEGEARESGGWAWDARWRSAVQLAVQAFAKSRRAFLTRPERVARQQPPLTATIDPATWARHQR